MAILYGGASGVVGNSGSANAVLRVHANAVGVVGHSGSARGTIIVSLRVTQFGVGLDVGDVVDAAVTTAGIHLDVDRIVPTNITTAGAHLDVDRIVPTDVTTVGANLDVDRIVPTNITIIGAQVDARIQRIRTLTMCWEFHVYTRGGTYLTYLDNAYDKSYLSQLWDVGGGSFKLPTDDAKATSTNLKPGNVVVVRYANVDIGAWIMETIATTYVDTGEGAARIITVSGRGLLASLAKGLVYPTDLGDPDTSERSFSATTKADIFLTLHDEFGARGGGLLTTTFSATNDTDSVAWSDSLSLKYRAGQTLLDVLHQLQGFGFEVIARPNKTLDAYVSAGTDKSVGVAFRYGQNMLACSTSLNGTDIANAVLGEGQNLLDEDTNATSITEYGRQEAHLAVRNTATAGDISAANTVYLSTYANPPQSIALQVTTFPDYPILDYDIGDTVHVSVPGELDTDYRILAIALEEASGPCDLRVTLELNSMQAEYLSRLQRAMEASLASIKPDAGSGMGSGSTANTATGSTPAIPDILTTKGDLVTRSTTAYVRQGVGSNGQFLRADSTQTTGLVWDAPPYGSCYGNAIAWAQASAAQNTWYAVADTDMSDGQLSGVTHDGSGKLTVGEAGKYLVTYAATLEASGSVHVESGIQISGTVQNDGRQDYQVFATDSEFGVASMAILSLLGSATVEVVVRTTDAGTPTLRADHLNLTVVQVGV